MKFIPVVTEFDVDMQELKKIMRRVCHILYKYDVVGKEDMSEEEYLESVLKNIEEDIHDLKDLYESRNKES